jgi:hypothetical protein
MQAGDYILHAYNGVLRKVSVEKIRLPLDPAGHVQWLGMALAPGGTIYASQKTIISRSTDGGRTWEHLKRDHWWKLMQRDPTRAESGGWLLQVNGNGRLLNIDHPLPVVWASDNDGETWERIGQIDVTPFVNVVAGYTMARLSDGTLLLPIQSRDAFRVSEDWANLIFGGITTWIFRSKDGGYTFPYRSVLGDWCHEVNIAVLPSGRLLAVIRYQRPCLPEDPPDLLECTGAAVFGSSFPYKHVFLADSVDGGVTWTNFRQLTTVFGQCHGSAVGLSDNRVVVVHDHRYPREVASGRAMVSYDGGQTWADEVYYLCHGNAAGFSQTVTLDGKELLTLIGSCYGDVGAWDSCIGRSHFVLIRWRLLE